jgi:hypothetical protein
VIESSGCGVLDTPQEPVIGLAGGETGCAGYDDLYFTPDYLSPSAAVKNFVPSKNQFGRLNTETILGRTLHLLAADQPPPNFDGSL